MWILCGILLFLLLLLSLRLRIEGKYDGAPSLTVQIGPIRRKIDLKAAPKQQKKTDADKKKSRPEQKHERKNRLTAGQIPALLSLLGKLLQRIGKKLRIAPLVLHLTVGGADPAETAQRFGWINAALWPLLSLIQKNCDLKQQEVTVNLDYDQEEMIRGTGEIGLSLRVGQALAIALWALIALLRMGRTAGSRQENTQKLQTPEVGAAQ